jgi:hypothetical protein
VFGYCDIVALYGNLGFLLLSYGGNDSFNICFVGCFVVSDLCGVLLLVDGVCFDIRPTERSSVLDEIEI